MQKRRRTALVPAVAVTTLALAAAQFGAGDAAASPRKRLDKLDAKRPAAAAQLAEAAPYGVAHAVAETALGATVTEYVQKAQMEFLAAEFARIQAEQEQAGASNSGSSGPGYSVGGGSGGGSAPGSFLSCTRQRESGGNYATDTGNGYHGAYQFLQSTWNSTAASAGRGDLVGVNPAQASPADQDAMASQLYSTSGSAPWGGRCG